MLSLLIKYKHGFSFIEILIAITISMLCVNIFCMWYLNEKKLFNKNINQLDFYYTLNKTHHILSDIISNAGFSGCKRLTAEDISGYQQYHLNPNTKILGNENNLTISYLDNKHANVIQSSNQKNVIMTTNNILFYKNDILAITDCRGGEIFKVSEVILKNNIQIIYPVNKIKRSHWYHADVSKLMTNTFFVKNNKLMIKNIITQRARSILSHVKNIFFKYHVLINGKIIEVNEINKKLSPHVLGVTIDIQFLNQEKETQYIALSNI